MVSLAISTLTLGIVVLCLACVVFALVRQVKVLHARIAPAGALMINRGPAIGARVDTLEVVDLAGRVLRIGAARADGRSTLILFLSPTCPVCRALLPVVRSSREQERGWLDIVLASDGDPADHRRFVRDLDLRDFPYVISAALGMTFQVSRLPFAALLDDGGLVRARGLVNSREHLESLFEAKRLGVASLQEYFAGS